MISHLLYRVKTDSTGGRKIHPDAGYVFGPASGLLGIWFVALLAGCEEPADDQHSCFSLLFVPLLPTPGQSDCVGEADLAWSDGAPLRCAEVVRPDVCEVGFFRHDDVDLVEDEDRVFAVGSCVSDGVHKNAVEPPASFVDKCHVPTPVLSDARPGVGVAGFSYSINSCEYQNKKHPESEAFSA